MTLYQQTIADEQFIPRSPRKVNMSSISFCIFHKCKDFFLILSGLAFGNKINSKLECMSKDMEKVQLPGMVNDGIHAGFPSPATDYMTQAIDLNKELVRHPTATFYGRVVGDSMIDAGVEEGDILVIDRALDARDGDMAVCFVDGEFALKYIHIREGGLTLRAANDKYAPIEVSEGSEFKMWGVVTYIIKKVR